MFDLSRLTDVVGDLLGQSGNGLDAGSVIEQLRSMSFDPAQLQELLGNQLDLEALGLQDINFADLSVDQIFAVLAEKGVDVSQLDLSALTESDGVGDLIGNAVGSFLSGGKS
ncbi:MAG: hypothetical protein AAFR55_05590 [Pseudomonadota bacterium]